MLVKIDLAFLPEQMHGIVGPEKEKQAILEMIGRLLEIQIH